MLESERKDVEFMMAHKLTDLGLAHEQRLKAEADAAETIRVAELAMREKAKQAKDEYLIEILMKHPDRWVASINGRKVVPGKKTVELKCPCGFSPPEILSKLGDVMQATFRGLLAENFANHNGSAQVIVSDLKCPKCGKRVLYRLIPIPY